MRQRGKEDEPPMFLDQTDARDRYISNRRQRRQFGFLLVVLVAGTALVFVLALTIGLGIGYWAEDSDGELPSDPHTRAVRLLTDFPLIDGWVDLCMM